MKKSALALFLIASLPASAGDPVKLDPTTLREKLLADNVRVMEQWNQVSQAKRSVEIMRGSLLPSLNLGVVLSTMQGPTFVLSTVDMLLPFLIPSNWFSYGESKHLFESEKIGYHLFELNEYASALSLYYQLILDRRVRDALDGERKDLRDIQDELEREDSLGTVIPADLDHAKAEADLAEIQVTQMDSLLARESAALAAMLSLPIETSFELSEANLDPVPAEAQAASQVADMAFGIAPEALQIDRLIAAAKDHRWSKIFSFLTGDSLSAQAFPGASGAPQSVSFGRLLDRANGGIGFGFYPAIELADDQLDALELRTQELKLELGQVVEGALASVVAAKRETELAASAEAGMQKVYEDKLDAYDLGMETLVNVLEARTGLTQAAISRAQAEIDLDQQRVTLDRILLSGPFAPIPACKLAEPMPKPQGDGFWGKIGRIFHRDHGDPAPAPTVDELCK